MAHPSEAVCQPSSLRGAWPWRPRGAASVGGASGAGGGRDSYEVIRGLTTATAKPYDFVGDCGLHASPSVRFF